MTDKTERKAPGRKNTSAAEVRKDIRFYLRPTKAVNEQYAADKLSKLQGETQDHMRQFSLAGLALAEVDSRLPAVLASMLKPGVTGTEIEAVLRAFLSMDLSLQPQVVKSEESSKTIGSARNLRNMLPD
ncbi:MULTISPECIES: plasmid partitioning/stability family protein [Enterobacteriaceae]|uniref:plasmid partitioning/stability family protein n=1 Tax=Enterobacteriaceae TaxID=543 RepID=UPI000B7E7747|nr:MULTISPECIES: plasmid partitioning/stability family protein [Enterobacteriaceae]OXL33873.1 hypothetical protein CA284_21905 [Enterobacter mori]CAH8249970.1 Uncharacterised protein [Enterobacter ludwigii]CAH8250374.1 Uncharacterised protein [Escherichia coli]